METFNIFKDGVKIGEYKTNSGHTSAKHGFCNLNLGEKTDGISVEIIKPGKVMVWDGEKLKYGITQSVIDILGSIIETVPANMLDGMGTHEAKEIKQERLHSRRIGAINF